MTRTPTMHHLVDALVDRLDRDVLDATPTRLHVHAGVVRRDDRAVVVLGPSPAPARAPS